MADIQTVSIAVASAGVFLAAIYCTFQLRYSVKAREMELCRLATSDFNSEQGVQRYATMMNMEWKDYDRSNQDSVKHANELDCSNSMWLRRGSR